MSALRNAPAAGTPTVPILRPCPTSHWNCLTGTFSATVVTLAVPRPIVHSWLHSGLRLPPGDDRSPHPVHLYFGQQAAVSPALFGIPMRALVELQYKEIILAVPDLEVRSDRIPVPPSPVTYFPHLFLGAWIPTLIGRGFYAINKSFARIDSSDGRVSAVNRHGRRLLDARMTPVSGAPAVPWTEVARSNPTCLLKQPLVVGRRGRIKLARFEIQEPETDVTPVRVALDMAEGFVSWLPALRADIPGIDERSDGAFQASFSWRLSAAPPSGSNRRRNAPPAK